MLNRPKISINKTIIKKNFFFLVFDFFQLSDSQSPRASTTRLVAQPRVHAERQHLVARRMASRHRQRDRLVRSHSRDRRGAKVQLGQVLLCVQRHLSIRVHRCARGQREAVRVLAQFERHRAEHDGAHEHDGDHRNDHDSDDNYKKEEAN